jgi:putative N-acetyltransferase (TIGR04045 family)
MPDARTICRIVTSTAEVAEHHRIRTEVFVTEQELFVGDDFDPFDELVTTLKVVAFRDHDPAGTVRLFPLDRRGERWQGDRLAVLAPFRRFTLGIPLVRFAVATAGQRGGSVMSAHIQPANVPFFEHLGWRSDGAIETYVGVPHQPMCIDLSSDEGQ